MIAYNVNLVLFLFSLVKIETGCDWVVTSTYRSVKKNKAVHGAPASRHLKGLAIDAVPRCSLEEEKVFKAGYKWFDRVYYYKKDGHWHFDIREER